MPSISVRVLDVTNGQVRAQILVGTKRTRATALTEFAEEIRRLFGDNPQPGQEVRCEETADPTPASVRPVPGAKIQRAGQGAPLTPDRSRPAARGAPPTIRPPVHRQLPPPRPQGELAVDRNPYNFVPWIGNGPPAAQEPQQAAHDKVASDRLSGQITVTFTARTPIFVPEGRLQNGDHNTSGGSGIGGNTSRALDFFHCWNGQRDQYAIPGASVKGAVRSLYEAFTNSRAGVTDDDALRRPPLYRRRATRLFRLVSKPDGNQDGEVRQCEYVWYRPGGPPRQSENYRRTAPNQKRHEQWRANLFWVEPERHRHGNTLQYYETEKTFILKKNTLKQYESMQKDGGHPHLIRHGGTKGNAVTVPEHRRMYRGAVPEYSEIEKELFALEEGDFIFGIPNNGELQCFGKNVNFLWPGARSPLAMMMGSPGGDARGAFAALEPEKQRLAGSDPAEATFGFAGKHGDDSHPFRGRVRFGIFWGPCVTTDKRPDLQLMPLTSPSGAKAKARPLYLEPASDGLSADYDGAARLRGRKFYWHQHGRDGSIPEVHDLTRQNTQARDTIQSQLPPKITPLPVDSRFTGTLHFANLTEAELGALLVSIKPDLAFGSESAGSAGSPGTDPREDYGIKLGKGKPRGLGSVTACIKLELAAAADERYRRLDAPLAENKTAEAATYVKAYKAWCVKSHKEEARHGAWDDLKMAKALKALLRIPESPSVRVYPPDFPMYGWQPKLDDPNGAPTSPRGRPPAPRPKAMTPAYEVKAP